MDLTYLNDIEKDALYSFNQNETMVRAVKKVLLAGIYENGILRQGDKAEPLKNFALALAFKTEISNEQVGADLRASAAGIRSVELAFNKIAEIQPKKDVKVEVKNPAR